MKYLLAVTLLSLLICPIRTFGQTSRPIPPGIRQADQAEDKFEKNSVPPQTQPRASVDPAKLRRDADELAALAQSLPSQVEQTTKGVLPKDLNDRLKRIEKLAKQLRSQISQ